MIQLIYILLGILGLSFLIFIHELGHYIMARLVGMRVEVFSIGFGRPFYSWNYQGVRWQLCYLLIGGYVKIAGMDREGDKEPHDVKDGFFSKSPWARMQVAFMGPIVNIVFAFLAFGAIYLTGGREKEFHDQTKIIGYIDPKSELYAKGIRPGDVITQLDGEPYGGFRDILYTSVSQKDQIAISGFKINYQTGEKSQFSYSVTPYEHPFAANKEFRTIGILSPANYLVYDRLPDGRDNPIAPLSPMYESGIQYGDRIIWIDGHIIFSWAQLRQIINEPISLLTIQRGQDVLQVRVPRVYVGDMRLSKEELAEMSDWQHEMGIKGDLRELIFIPYNLDSHCKVESTISYVDESLHVAILDKDSPLQKGDHILAVDGAAVVSTFQLLEKIQKRQMQIIVKKEGDLKPFSYRVQDRRFEEGIDEKALQALIAKIGTESNPGSVGDLKLLKGVTPIPRKDVPRSLKRQAFVDSEIEKQEEKIAAIKDSKQREKAEQDLKMYQNQLFLGIALQDRLVNYNPAPWKMFTDVVDESVRTVKGLFGGSLKPKWLSGPVGIVHMMGYGYSLGIKEALYWMALISLNLGILNLLPIPALDGGHICFSLYEMITRRRIKASLMEKLVIPFFVLLMIFLVYVTYQDVMRLIF